MWFVFSLLLYGRMVIGIRAPGAPDTSDLYMDLLLSSIMYNPAKSPLTLNFRYADDRLAYRRTVELRPISFNCSGCEGIDACLASGTADECVAAAPETAIITELAWLIIPSQNTCGDAGIRENVFGFQMMNPELVDWIVYAQDIYLDLIYLSPSCAGVFLQVRPMREDAARLSCMTLGNDGNLTKFTRVSSDNSLIIHLEQDVPLGLYNRRWIFTAVDQRFLPPEDNTQTSSPTKETPSSTTQTSTEDTESTTTQEQIRRLGYADDKLDVLLGIDPLAISLPTTTQPVTAPDDNYPELPVGPEHRELGYKYAHRYYWSEPTDQECYMMGQWWNNIVIGVKRERAGTGTSQT